MYIYIYICIYIYIYIGAPAQTEQQEFALTIYSPVPGFVLYAFVKHILFWGTRRKGAPPRCVDGASWNARAPLCGGLWVEVDFLLHCQLEGEGRWRN